MGAMIAQRVRGMGWKARISLVLIFTLVFSTFMHQGWYKPMPAEAAVSLIGTAYRSTGTTGPHTITNAQFSCGAGSNRLLVAVVTAEYGTANAMTMGAVKGAQTFTQAVATTATARTGVWIGYLTESQISGNTSDIVVTETAGGNSWSGSDVYLQCFSGVDQTTRIVASGTAQLASDTAATSWNFSVPYVAGGAIIFGNGNNNAGPNSISVTPATYTEWYDVAGTGYATGSGHKLFASSGTENGTITISASQRYANAVISLNAASSGNLTIGNGTNPADANAPQGSINNALDAFTLVMSAGTGTASSLTVTGNANFHATNIPTNGVKIYRDAGTVGTLDGADTLISSGSTAISGNATTVTLSAAETVTTTSANYLVVVDINPGATVANTITANISAATGSGLGTVTDNDSASATLTVTAGASLTIGQGTDPSNANAPRSSTNNALDAFTLSVSSGTGSITALTVTGSANFTSTNIPTNGVKIWRDTGTIGVLDGADAQISSSSTAISSNATTVTLASAETVTTSPANYLVTVDITAGATLAQTFTGTISAATGSGYVSTTDNDTASATLTITAAQTLTVGNGTNPANANVATGSTNKALDAFTLVLNTGTGSANTLTLTGSAQFTTTNVSNIKIYRDTGTVGTLDGSDTLVTTTYSHVGTNATITFTAPEAVSTTTASYLVVLDIAGGATPGSTLSGTITAATGTGLGTPAYNDSASATLTITAGPVATITSCAGCHGYGAIFTDGSSRNNPSGTFPGSHNTHVAVYSKLCSTCHVAPATETSTDFNHRNELIEMANPINGNSGASYGKGTSWTQTNSPSAMQGCSNTYCHSNGTSATTPPGSIPANTSTVWGGTTACNSCHGTGDPYGRPNYTDGTPKANKHQAATHAAQTCNVCHNSVTYSGGVYTPIPSLHVNGSYNLNVSLGYTAGSAAAGGTCATPGCHSGINWGGQLGCTDCHGVAQNSPAAQALDASVTQRRAIVPEFQAASNHVRNKTGGVTDADCGVCHMEGNASDGSVNGTYHKNGYVELRDPDSGSTIKQVTWGGAGAGSYSSTATDATFVRFSRNLSSSTLETAATAIQINHCLKCHDSVGAASTSARITGGSATNPFNATAASMPAGRVLDVYSQVATTNRAYHPILGKQNNGYAGGTRMSAPWNGVTKSGTTTVWGPLMTCWDCHAASGATGTITTTVTAHGSAVTSTTGTTNAVELRGYVWRTGTVSATNNTTLCVVCHAGYDTQTASNHGTGSAFTSNTNNNMTLYLRYACYYCHSSGPAKAARPTPAADAHGYNTRSTGAAFAANNYGYAFIRSEGFYGNGYTHSVANVGGTGYTATCTGFNGTNGSTNCSRNSMGNYTPGGVY